MRGPRVLSALHWIAVVALVAGAIDPMEGSLLILPAAIVLALVAMHAHLQSRRQAVWGAVLVTLGTMALWGLSAGGGIGGRTGRSPWWAVLLLPYPVGWFLTLAGGLRGPAAGGQLPAPTKTG